VYLTNLVLRCYSAATIGGDVQGNL